MSPSRLLKGQIFTFAIGNNEKLAVKHSIEKSFFLNFMNLSTILCPSLYISTFTQGKSKLQLISPQKNVWLSFQKVVVRQSFVPHNSKSCEIYELLFPLLFRKLTSASNQNIASLIIKLCAWSTAQKMKFSTKDFFSKCDQIRRRLSIWSHLWKKSLVENFIFCAVIWLIKE